MQNINMWLKQDLIQLTAHVIINKCLLSKSKIGLNWAKSY
jgi:hypothetical protein